MRIVVDTNLFASAVLKHSSLPFLVVRWIDEYGGLLKSAATERKILSVLSRPQIAAVMLPTFRPIVSAASTCTRRGCECNLIAMRQPVVSRSPEVMGGTAVFYGTRVPAQTLLDTIDDFLEGFPSVTRDQVIAFLEEAKDRLIETVS